jgi:hypothetical protein
MLEPTAGDNNAVTGSDLAILLRTVWKNLIWLGVAYWRSE